MKYGGQMMDERNLVDQIRSVMAPANPVSASSYQGDQLYQAETTARMNAMLSADPTTFQPEEASPLAAPGRRTDRANRANRTYRPHAPAWRFLAPALSGFAVVAIALTLSLASGSAARPSAPGSAASQTGRTTSGTGGSTGGATAPMPRYILTVNKVGSRLRAIVHSSRTGQVLSQLLLPPTDMVPSITAARSDREFYLVADRIVHRESWARALYRLRISRSGQNLTMTRLPISPTATGSSTWVSGIALSPDGSKLAVTEQSTDSRRADLLVVPLNGGPARIWSASGKLANLSNPSWAGGNTRLDFLWDGSAGHGGREELRELNTAAPGRSPLAGRIVATRAGRFGALNTAFASPDGGPIIASSYINHPHSVTTMLVAISPATGKVTPLMGENIGRVSGGPLGRAIARDSCRVLGVAPAGQHALVVCPGLFRLDDGKATRVPGAGGPGNLDAATW